MFYLATMLLLTRQLHPGTAPHFLNIRMGSKPRLGFDEGLSKSFLQSCYAERSAHIHITPLLSAVSRHYADIYLARCPLYAYIPSSHRQKVDNDLCANYSARQIRTL